MRAWPLLALPVLLLLIACHPTGERWRELEVGNPGSVTYDTWFGGDFPEWEEGLRRWDQGLVSSLTGRTSFFQKQTPPFRGNYRMMLGGCPFKPGALGCTENLLDPPPHI